MTNPYLSSSLQPSWSSAPTRSRPIEFHHCDMSCLISLTDLPTWQTEANVAASSNAWVAKAWKSCRSTAEIFLLEDAWPKTSEGKCELILWFGLYPSLLLLLFNIILRVCNMLSSAGKKNTHTTYHHISHQRWYPTVVLCCFILRVADIHYTHWLTAKCSFISAILTHSKVNWSLTVQINIFQYISNYFRLFQYNSAQTYPNITNQKSTTIDQQIATNINQPESTIVGVHLSAPCSFIYLFWWYLTSRKPAE